MAETTQVIPAFVGRLSDALRQELPGAEVEHELIRGTRYRFIIVWDRFDSMDHPERQRLVWNIAERVVPGEELWDVGMILTLGREDLPRDDSE